MDDLSGDKDPIALYKDVLVLILECAVDVTTVAGIKDLCSVTLVCRSWRNAALASGLYYRGLFARYKNNLVNMILRVPQAALDAMMVERALCWVLDVQPSKTYCARELEWWQNGVCDEKSILWAALCRNALPLVRFIVDAQPHQHFAWPWRTSLHDDCIARLTTATPLDSSNKRLKVLFRECCRRGSLDSIRWLRDNDVLGSGNDSPPLPSCSSLSVWCHLVLRWTPTAHLEEALGLVMATTVADVVDIVSKTPTLHTELTVARVKGSCRFLRSDADIATHAKLLGGAPPRVAVQTMRRLYKNCLLSSAKGSLLNAFKMFYAAGMLEAWLDSTSPKEAREFLRCCMQYGDGALADWIYFSSHHDRWLATVLQPPPEAAPMTTTVVYISELKHYHDVRYLERLANGVYRGFTLRFDVAEERIRNKYRRSLHIIMVGIVSHIMEHKHSKVRPDDLVPILAWYMQRFAPPGPDRQDFIEICFDIACARGIIPVLDWTREQFDPNITVTPGPSVIMNGIEWLSCRVLARGVQPDLGLLRWGMQHYPEEFYARSGRRPLLYLVMGSASASVTSAATVLLDMASRYLPPKLFDVENCCFLAALTQKNAAARHEIYRWLLEHSGQQQFPNGLDAYERVFGGHLDPSPELTRCLLQLGNRPIEPLGHELRTIFRFSFIRALSKVSLRNPMHFDRFVEFSGIRAHLKDILYCFLELHADCVNFWPGLLARLDDDMRSRALRSIRNIMMARTHDDDAQDNNDQLVQKNLVEFATEHYPWQSTSYRDLEIFIAEILVPVMGTRHTSIFLRKHVRKQARRQQRYWGAFKELIERFIDAVC